MAADKGRAMNEGIAYGADELAAVAELCGAPAFPGVQPVADLAADARRAAALQSARRSLLARGVLEIDDEGTPAVAPPHSILFRAALAPAAVINAEHRRSGFTETRSYYVLPAIAVEHTCTIGRVHRLTQLDSALLFERVLEFVQLVERPPGDASEFEAVVSELNRALVFAGNEGEKPNLPAEAAAFEQALEGLVSTAFVRSLSRSDGAFVGGELRWIDTGERGSGSSSRATRARTRLECARPRRANCSMSSSRTCPAPSVSRRPERARSGRAERGTHGPAGTSWRCAAAA